MNDNLRRKMQEIDLGVHEAPIALPEAICAQAVQSNRFSIVGVLVNPQKQNMRALIGQMPRLRGLADEVVGRIVEPTKFQFVFRSEEALNLVLRRGPWSFSEWMLVTRRWDATLTPNDLKIIPFWVQIRGIPSQFLNRQMVEFIADRIGPIGQVRDIEFDEAANLTDYVRVKIDWNIDHPLKFQRNFQFNVNENTTLKFRYEKLRNFCVKCGMLSHEAKDCPQRDLADDMPDDSPDPDGNGNDGQFAPPEAHVPDDVDTHSAPVTGKVFPKEEAGMKGDPGSTSANDECKPVLPQFDVDMAAETIRYIKAKLAKGKFLKGELRTWLQLLDNAEAGPQETKTEEEDFFVKKRKRVEVVDWDIEDSPTSRLDLFPACKKEKIESIDSCSGNDDDGGAGGPVPPLFP
ncbi:hypothetical protein BRARA_G02235 [Brassica rapa]|uniref:CCHC-type domain-containing protein n=1 Tax=Brassica campestris TaxID=3711 RepID=A0A397YNH2_BRACM|nr:hypothetical protein BRARA_G02235 [Brassica rapa]